MFSLVHKMKGNFYYERTIRYFSDSFEAKKHTNISNRFFIRLFATYELSNKDLPHPR